MEQIRQNIKEFFQGITFEEEGHKYCYNGTPMLHSVSTKIDQFHKPFDSYNISKAISERTGIPQQDILEEWKKENSKAIFIGKKAHLFGELYTFNRQLRPETQYDVAIMKFWKDLPNNLVPVCTELQMFHKEFLYPGTLDTLLYNTKTGKFVITDYKTNKNIFKNYKNQKLLERFKNFLDNPFNKYQIQLSYYKILFEQTGYEVEDMRLVWIKPDGNYELYKVQDLTQYLK